MKKKLLIITSIFAVAAVIYGCKKAFLEQAPQGVYDLASLTNKKGVEGMLINAYATLDGIQDQQNGGASNWLWGSIRGGDAYKGTEFTDMVDANPIMRFELLPSVGQLPNKWNAIWDGVGGANQVLTVLPLATDISSADATQIEAEAKFIRGFMLFEGKKAFNNIPYIDETITDFKVPNTDGGGYVNIWPQIEGDLKFGYDNLDEVRPQVGRVNKWAAGAFLAKAYMFQNKFAEAKALFDLIITSGKTSKGLPYDLTPNYNTNFRVLTENNAETVFSIQASYGDGANTNGNYDNTLNYPHGGSATTEKPGACCGFFQPSQNLVNSFRTSALGLPLPGTYNDVDVTSDEPFTSDDLAFVPYAGTLDPRLDWTVGRRGIPYYDWGLHPGRNWIRDYRYGGPFSPKKNTYYKADIGTLAGTVGWGFANNALNYTPMRFADVLLLAAEAEIEVGSLSVAMQYINKVRARAAAAPVMNGAAPAANYLVNQYITPFADQNAARIAVRFERKIELGMEGHRFFDLVRWGIADVFLNNEYFAKEAIRRPSALGGSVFVKGKHEYLPIPEFAITTSIKDGDPTLMQNPGY